jgi:hypothetical protein
VPIVWPHGRGRDTNTTFRYAEGDTMKQYNCGGKIHILVINTHLFPTHVSEVNVQKQHANTCTIFFIYVLSARRFLVLLFRLATHLLDLALVLPLKTINNMPMKSTSTGYQVPIQKFLSAFFFRESNQSKKT